MDLRERLRLLKAAGAARAAADRAPRAAAPLPFDRARPQTGPAGEPLPFRLCDGLEGELVPTGAGSAFRLESRHPLTEHRGPLPLGWPLDLPAAVWPRLGRVAPEFDIRRAVFLDTETTGLAGGTGTYAFLVGLGFFEGDHFVVRQYFLRDYPEEEAMLAAIEADVAPFTCLVTFNGKSFDWPLLETRFRMARRRPPLAGAPHLDLLHPARRLWRDRLGSCSLQDLERNVLGEYRVGDVPGSQIPALYFEYLRTGDASPLAGVVEHNRLDILSLAALAGRMGQMVADPLGPTPDGELLCGDDLYQLGRLFEARGLLADALACYQEARVRGAASVTEAVLLRRLSFAYKRAREQRQAVAIWEQMVESGGLALFPYIELAKYHEHVTRRYDLAEALTARALAVAEQRRSLTAAGGQAEYREVLHRLERLRRKRQRSSV
ncbi:ribonuclease H-like domain-containing protein [Symbiobacterium terraclitae]|uniref:ribonuclease H-like domain-containing protein n=1 Tax=Symbiobacterium terraclitae TaxID=557451 RepID=UPI0035B51361